MVASSTVHIYSSYQYNHTVLYSTILGYRSIRSYRTKTGTGSGNHKARETGPAVSNMYLPLLLSLCFGLIPEVGSFDLGTPLKKIMKSKLGPRLDTDSETFVLKRSAETVGLSRPWNFPKFAWKTAWTVQSTLLPWLHRWDRCKPEDTYVNLSVLWWKAIAGNRLWSATSDGGFAFDLLPPVTRRVVGFPLCYLYPKLHHQNVAIRTAFLDQALELELESATAKAGGIAPIVIILGAGFDTRAVRFALRHPHAKWVELDLPAVVLQKQALLTERLVARRPGVVLPGFQGADFNDNADFRRAVEAALRREDRGPCSAPAPPVVFVFEAVVLYLEQPRRPFELLQACAGLAAASGAPRVAFVFADRLPHVTAREVTDALKAGAAPLPWALPPSTPAATPADTPVATPAPAVAVAVAVEEGDERGRAARFWRAVHPGLDLTSWLPKPGKANHMGVAVVDLQ